MDAMRLMLLVLACLAPCLPARTARAQETQIHAIIALETKDACTTALGFVIESGKDRDAVRKQVEDKARAKFPQSRNSTHADNFKKDKHLGNHAVVVSASVGKPGCTGRAMGVGFGQDEKAARKDAERLLGKVFPYRKDDFKVEHSKAY